MAVGKGQGISAPEDAHRDLQPAAEALGPPEGEHLGVAHVVHWQDVCRHRNTPVLIHCSHSHIRFLIRGMVNLQLTQGCQNPKPSWTRLHKSKVHV